MKKNIKYIMWLGVIGVGVYLAFNWKWLANKFGLYSETSTQAY